MWLAVWALGCGSDDKGSGSTDVGVDPTADSDLDDDGYDVGPDCDDGDPTIHPDADEVPYDGIDQDCADGDLVDVDADGHEPPEDCDDADPAAHPGASDTVGDGVDQDCDDVDGIDADEDTFASEESGGTDCDDADPARNPVAVEIWYDAIDQDCDGHCDYDQDNDGAVLTGSPIVDGSPCDATPGPLAYADEDCDDGDPTASTAVVVETSPEDGSATVTADAIVQVTLSTPEPAASMVLLDPFGTPVPGASSVAGAVVSFVPSAPLAGSTSYTAETTYSCGIDSLSFTTVGPVDATSLVGRVWYADIVAGDWVEPPGVGPLVPLLFSSAILLTVPAEAPGTLDLRAGVGAAGLQDLCSTTVELPGTPFDANPFFSAGPADLPMSAMGVSLVLDDATVDGVFAADGSAIFELAIAANVDTRDLDAALGGPGATCGLLVVFGVTCDPCPDGSGPYCLDLEVRDVPTTEVVGGSLVVRTAADIAADPSCP